VKRRAAPTRDLPRVGGPDKRQAPLAGRVPGGVAVTSVNFPVGFSEPKQKADAACAQVRTSCRTKEAGGGGYCGSRGLTAPVGSTSTPKICTGLTPTRRTCPVPEYGRPKISDTARTT
jgi:hypothetical protein